MKVSLLTKLTLADLDRMAADGNRYELIDGELFATPPPFEPHQRALLNLASELAEFADRHDLGHVYMAPFDVYLPLPGATRETRVQPDILFISKKRSHIIQGWVYGAPDLMVEVAGEPTARADYYEKRDAYRAAGVREYWVVNPNDQTVTVHRFETGEALRVLSREQTLTTPPLPGFELPVAYLFR